MNEISRKAASDGSELRSGGGGSRQVKARHNARQLCCKVYRTQQRSTPVEGERKNVDFEANQRARNNRPKGKSKPKNSTSQKAVRTRDGRKAKTCNLRINLKYDHLSFFMVVGQGNAYHSNHPPKRAHEVTTRCATLPETIIQKVQEDTNIAAIPTGAALSLTNHRLEGGQKITRRQALFLQGRSSLSKEAQTLDSPQYSPLDRALVDLAANGASVITLMHTGVEDSSQLWRQKRQKTTSTTSQSPSHLLISESHAPYASSTISTTDKLGEDMMQYATEKRVELNATDNQDVCLAIVWSLPEMRRAFRELHTRHL